MLLMSPPCPKLSEIHNDHRCAHAKCLVFSIFWVQPSFPISFHAVPVVPLCPHILLRQPQQHLLQHQGVITISQTYHMPLGFWSLHTFFPCLGLSFTTQPLTATGIQSFFKANHKGHHLVKGFQFQMNILFFCSPWEPGILLQPSPQPSVWFNQALYILASGTCLGNFLSDGLYPLVT